MASLIPPELTLNCSSLSSPKTGCDFLAQVLRMDDVSDKLLKLKDLVNRLEDEMKKIDAFKRELPLCMLLLSDAISRIKEEIIECKKSSNVKPILEEFIPLRSDERIEEVGREEEEMKEKMSWMRCVQLWNSDDHHHVDTDNKKKRKQEEEEEEEVGGKNRGIGFGPSKEETSLWLGTPCKVKEEINSSSRCSSSTKSVSLLSTTTSCNGDGRKQRRCWSQELHRRFVTALQQLGGAQAATPKQIRELMQVEGLTNDEVKSHLQKYRLHTRRVRAQGAGVGVGGLWMSEESSSKQQQQSNSQSSSPQGPLQLNTASSRATSVTDNDDNAGGGEEDDDTHSCCWKTTNKHF